MPAIFGNTPVSGEGQSARFLSRNKGLFVYFGVKGDEVEEGMCQNYSVLIPGKY